MGKTPGVLIRNYGDMSAEWVSSNVVEWANDARPRRVWAAFCERVKTIGNRNVSCTGADCLQ